MTNLDTAYRAAFTTDTLNPDPAMLNARRVYNLLGFNPAWESSHPDAAQWGEDDAFAAGWDARGVRDTHAGITEWSACVCGDGTPENPTTHTTPDLLGWTDEPTARAEAREARVMGAGHAHLITRTTTTHPL